MPEIRTLRDRQQAQSVRMDRTFAAPPYGKAAMLVTTTTVTTYPTSASSFFAGNPTQVNGLEAEGVAVSYVVDTSTVLYFYNTGSQIPPNGTRLIVLEAGNKWVTRYDG
jgi:hypothetical protein